MSALKFGLKTLASLLVALVLGLLALRQWQPGLEQLKSHQVPAIPAPSGAVTARWFGVTAVLISDGESTIFVDPFFTRPPGLLNMMLNRPIGPDEAGIAKSLAAADVKTLAAVLVSHSHFDHGMDAGVVARLTGAKLLGSESTANIGRGSGLQEAQIQVIQPDQPYRFGSFTLTFIASEHAGATGGTPVGDIAAPLKPPAGYLDYKLGGAYSILIEHPRGRVLHHGSAGYRPGALKKVRAEVALLGVALVNDLPEYLRETVDAVGATRIVPTHWDDFTLPLDQPLRVFPLTVRLDRFFEHLRTRPDLKVQAAELGQPIVLF